MEKPLYTEEHGSGNTNVLAATHVIALIVTALSLVGIYLFFTIIRTFFPGMNLNAVEIVLIALVASLYVLTLVRLTKNPRSIQTVEYFQDRLMVRSGKNVKEVSYKDIRRLWKGPCLFARGRLVNSFVPIKNFVEDFPGLKFPSHQIVPGHEMRKVHEMLVWNPKIALGFGLLFSNTVVPLILERESQKDVDLLDTNNIPKVVEILRKNAPWIEFSPILDGNPVLR